MTPESTPPTVTAEQKGHIYGILSVGCDRQTAADYIGCSLTEFRNLMRHDAAFAKDVRRSEADAELKNMRNVQDVAREKKEWRASVWWLERRSPERFGRRTAGSVTARQLRGYLTLLAQMLNERLPDEKERQPFLDQLNKLSDEVDRILRNDQVLLSAILKDAGDAPGEEEIDPETEETAEDESDFDTSSWT
jgi:hypothetical protein